MVRKSDPSFRDVCMFFCLVIHLTCESVEGVVCCCVCLWRCYSFDMWISWRSCVLLCVFVKMLFIWHVNQLKELCVVVCVCEDVIHLTCESVEGVVWCCVCLWRRYSFDVWISWRSCVLLCVFVKTLFIWHVNQLKELCDVVCVCEDVIIHLTCESVEGVVWCCVCLWRRYSFDMWISWRSCVLLCVFVKTWLVHDGWGTSTTVQCWHSLQWAAEADVGWRYTSMQGRDRCCSWTVLLLLVRTS